MLARRTKSAGTGSTTANALATTGADVNVSNAAPPEAGDDFYASSASQAAWGNRLSRTFNVKNNKHSNLAGDGIDVYGVSITSGSTTLSIVYGSATFPTTITGKKIAVEGAGVGGGWLVTTATYLSPTTVTLGSAASATIGSIFSTYLYCACYYTNDTTAFQNLVLAAYRDALGNYQGNAKFILPDGLYVFDGPLQNGVTVPGYAAPIDFNSQAYIPGVPPDTNDPEPGNRTNGNISAWRWSVTLEGETPPHWMQSAGIGGALKVRTPHSGARIRSFIQGSGTLPSVICAKGGGTADGANGVNNNRFGPDLIMKNIQIQVTANASGATTMCGVNGYKAKTTQFYSCMVFPHNLDLQDSTAPSTATFGLIAAGSADEPASIIEACNVGGFKYGYSSGEHSTFISNHAWACETGLGLISTPYVTNIFGFEADGCKYDIGFCSELASVFGLSDTAIVNGIIAGERGHSSPYSGKWYENAAMVKDSSNLIYGTLKLAPEEASVGYGHARASKIGGENLRTEVVGRFPLVATHTGATYTLHYLYEAQQQHVFTYADAVLTIPKGDTATLAGYCYNYDIGAEIRGIGQVIPQGASGVTLNFPTGKTKGANANAKWTLTKTATNTWYFDGDLA